MIRGLILLVRPAINVLALLAADALFDGVRLDTWQATVGAAILLALVNAYLRPLLVMLTLPINILTLGLFTLLINAGLLKLVSWIIPAFHLTGFWTTVGAALLISLLSGLLNALLKPGHDFRVTVIRHSP